MFNFPDWSNELTLQVMAVHNDDVDVGDEYDEVNEEVRI